MEWPKSCRIPAREHSVTPVYFVPGQLMTVAPAAWQTICLASIQAHFLLSQSSLQSSQKTLSLPACTAQSNHLLVPSSLITPFSGPLDQKKICSGDRQKSDILTSREWNGEGKSTRFEHGSPTPNIIRTS
ncbi:unnamed protein product [Protopolystoma xenopodis]|uniref:Uncharacterized protein n=1 Tax=Protopolystoma xenopodis TaxID=117903 RepID=A0A3S5BP24_9PLAT|nr:unnamed protein product [Protopolystoma xenopodis]